MEKRRHFLSIVLKSIAALGILLNPFFQITRLLYAKGRKVILPKGTRRQDLIDTHPADLDTRNLDITPLKEFKTMGVSDHEVNLNEWTLEITGNVREPLNLAYSHLLSLPSVERDVLLICPGIFANHGQWKGISMREFLEKAGVKEGSTQVSFTGPTRGPYEKNQQYPIADLLSNRVFLAYSVNGEALPRRHGFPLRLVAEGYSGNEWVKYVYKVTVLKEDPAK